MRKVLVVDDESSIVTLLKYNLEEAGFQVITASRWLGRFASCNNENPDVIVLDWMLPNWMVWKFVKSFVSKKFKYLL